MTKKSQISTKDNISNQFPKAVKKRKWWFKILKKLMKCRYKQPTFVYLGQKIGAGSLVLSNHEGTDAPMSLEIWNSTPTRMWGAHEMNSGLIKMYKYQTKVYYHEKKHWNIHLARLFCLIASPLTNLFYKGLNLISTYRDQRFIKTIKESVVAIKNGETVVVFPEDSKNGYLENLEGFYCGFLVFADACLKQGIDLDVFVSYFRKSDLVYIFDEPIKYSKLCLMAESKEERAKILLDKCNQLGQMKFSEEQLNKFKEQQLN